MSNKMVKGLLSSFISVAVMCSFLSVLQAQTKTAAATVKVVIGNVKVSSAGQTEKINAEKGMLLSEGDTVYVGRKSLVSLVLVDGSEIKLNQKSVLEIEKPKGDETRVSLPIGQLWANIIKGKLFSVRTPTCVASVRGTQLDINVTTAGTDVMVIDGIVEVRNEYGTINVNPGETSSVKPETPPAAPVAFDAAKVDNWQNQVIEPEAKQEQPKQEVTKEEKKAKETKAEEPAAATDPEIEINKAIGNLVTPPVIVLPPEISNFVPVE